MATLLHIDSSVFPARRPRPVLSLLLSARSGRSSTRRAPSSTATSPPPLSPHHRRHLVRLLVTPPPPSAAQEQSAAFATHVKLIEELEQADAVLIGAPMYNYSIPSTLKAWLDNVLLLGRTAGETPLRPGRPGHRRRQPRRLLRTGHPARGLRVRTELPGGRPQEHPRPGPRLHRPRTHHGPPQSGHVRNWCPSPGLPQACLGGRSRQGRGTRGTPRRVEHPATDTV